MTGGWIKLYYKLLDWEWLDCPEMVGLWVNLLLRASREDRKWHGLTIRRGQLVTTLSELSEMAGLSLQKLRTCLDRLKSTREITCESTHFGTIVTICKYAEYQCPDEDEQQAEQHTDQQTSNTPATRQQHASNTPEASLPISSSTKSKHIQEGKKVKKEISPIGDIKKESPDGVLPLPSTNEKYLHFQEWIGKNAPRVARLEKPITEEQYEKLRAEFTGEEMKEILTQMNNYKPLLSKYVSAYDTCRTWLTRERERASPAVAAPKKTQQQNKSVNSVWGRD